MILRDIDRVLHSYDRGYRVRLLVILALSAMQTFLVVMRPLPVKFLVETPAPGTWLHSLRDWAGSTDHFVYVFAGLILVIEGAILAFRLAGEFRSTRLSETLIRRIRGDVAANLIQSPYHEVARVGVGRVLAAVVGDVQVIQQIIKDVVVAATLSALQLVLMLAVVYWLKETLFWILLAEIALLAVMIGIYSTWRKSVFLSQMRNQEAYVGWVSNTYLKNMDLRFSQSRNLFFQRTLTLARTMFRTGNRLWLVQSAYFGLVEFFLGLASAACLIVLVVESSSTGRNLGSLLVFLYYTVLVFPCLAKVGEAVPLMTDARNAYDRLLPLLGLKLQISRRASGLDMPRFGAIEFRGVGLQGQQGEWILRHVSFTVQPGEHVALFGDSGTGKSTLLGMLLGLIQPTEGIVLIDGIPVPDLALSDRKRMMLFQRSSAAFFNGSVAENVILGKSPTDIALARVLDDARLTARLAKDGFGIDGPMTERGEPFSQGEQQRIAIARVFLSNRPCIVLDEALNSLDEESEIAIVDALHRHLAGRTLLMISHRRSVAERLDTLHVLRRIDGQTVFQHDIRPRS